jgi:hypothetical protein
MARRLVLVGVMVLVSRGSVTQLVIATVLCAVYLLLQQQASPFADLGGAYPGLDLLISRQHSSTGSEVESLLHRRVSRKCVQFCAHYLLFVLHHVQARHADGAARAPGAHELGTARGTPR